MNAHRKRTSLGIAAAIAAVLLGGAAWLLSSHDEVPIDEATAVTTSDMPRGLAATAVDRAPSADDPATPSRDPSIEAAAAAATEMLHVRLRGTRREVPWTTPIQLTLISLEAPPSQNRFSVTVDIATDGHGACEVPARFASRTAFVSTATADDPMYERLHVGGAKLDATNCVTFDVAAIAPLAGRVVDARGAPVTRARVAAFHESEGRAGDRITETWVRENGAYSMKLPLPEAMMLVAFPDDDNALLPATVRTVARLGEPVRAPDLVLADVATVAGTVQWEDGSPVIGAGVRIVSDAPSSEVAEGRTVALEPGDVTLSTTVARTNDTGRFVLATVAGRSTQIELVSIPGKQLFGTLRHPVEGARQPTFVVPRPTELRVTRNGEPEDHATLVLDDGQRFLAREAVFTTTRKVRAESRRWCSDQVVVGPGSGTRTVDLPLLRQLTPVTLTMDSDSVPQGGAVEWTNASGQHGVANWTTDIPCVISVEPGPLQLRVTGWRHVGSGDLLCFAPFERSLVVGGDPQTVAVSMTPAGSLVVHAVDSRGWHVAGTCRVLDATGRDHATPFTVGSRLSDDCTTGRLGQLLSGGPNASDAIREGEYELVFEFPGFAPRRERVTIRAGEPTGVRLQLESR